MARRRTAQPEHRFLEQFLGSVWQLFKGLFTPKTGLSAADAAALAAHWPRIAKLLAEETTAPLAVSAADTLLDHALQKAGFAGATMAERLQAAQSRLGHDLSQAVWQAHKVRNRLAHEVGVQLAPGEAARAVTNLARGLRALGVAV